MVDAEATRSEIVTAAWALFTEMGYDKTTVNAVIERAGVSKGGFYHHFSSKSDLLDAILDRATSMILEPVHELVADPDMSALGKLNLLMDMSSQYKAEHMEALMSLTHALSRPENQPLRDRYQWRTLELLTPIYTRIIRQGAEDGVFDVPDAETAAEAVLLLGVGVREANMRAMLSGAAPQAVQDALQTRIDGWLWACERILGASKGSLDGPSKTMMDRFRMVLAAAPAQG